jgi:catechol 2,3-dioxygenase-like lactoylglutathione lyase family enzyme
MIQGINHITFAVRNLQVSFNFYMKVLGFQPIARWKNGAYLLCGDLWVCLNLDKNRKTNPDPDYTHVAFTVSEEMFESISKIILDSGAKQWSKNRSEGKSLYFLDPDCHKLEIHVGGWQSRVEALKQSVDDQLVIFRQ